MYEGNHERNADGCIGVEGNSPGVWVWYSQCLSAGSRAAVYICQCEYCIAAVKNTSGCVKVALVFKSFKIVSILSVTFFIAKSLQNGLKYCLNTVTPISMKRSSKFSNESLLILTDSCQA